MTAGSRIVNIYQMANLIKGLLFYADFSLSLMSCFECFKGKTSNAPTYDMQMPMTL